MGFYNSPELKQQLLEQGLFSLLLPLVPRERAQLLLQNTGKRTSDPHRSEICCVCGEGDLLDNDLFLWTNFLDVAPTNDDVDPGHVLCHKECCYNYQASVIWNYCEKKISEEGEKKASAGRKKTVSFAVNSDTEPTREAAAKPAKKPITGPQRSKSQLRRLIKSTLDHATRSRAKIPIAEEHSRQTVLEAAAHITKRSSRLTQQYYDTLLPALGMPETPTKQEAFWKLMNAIWKQEFSMS